jgi:PAS domain S-box-containing protein
MNYQTNTIRILIIDDDEDDFFILSEYIKKIPGYQFQVDWIFLYNEALQSLCDAKYDLYFVDYRLGIQTGLDLLKEAMSKNCEEPVILLSGKGNQQIDREAMEAGAIDYLVKSELNGEKLERCIRYSIERSRSMKALKQNEKKLRNIFEKSKDIVFLADEKLNFQDVNKAALDLLGYSHDQLLTLNLRELLYRDDPGFSITGILSDHGEIDDHILELKTITGEKIICLLSASREKVQNGSPYVQGILHDITNLKKMERANLQAEKLNTANRLLKILAHEVRGPLTNINLSVEELQAESLGPQSRVYMDIIYRN